MNIGVLDLQGSVYEHSQVVKSQKDNLILVKEPVDLDGLDGLIIPGGESTTLKRLLKIKKLDSAIIKSVENGVKVWGTCAGLVLLGSQLNLIDINIERNGYGSHSQSFTTDISFYGKLSKVKFIRAPKILSVGKNVSILASYDNSIIAAENENVIVTCFHPEVSDNLDFYHYFRRKIKALHSN